MKPKIRPLDIKPVNYEGDKYILLRDPLELSSQHLLIPRPLAAAIPFCDGNRDLAAIRAAAALASGLMLEMKDIEKLVNAMDMGLFLENDRMAWAYSRALEAYRQAPTRPPALAGLSYPADPEELRAQFQGYLEEVETSLDDGGKEYDAWRGIVCPHIDYPRGGPVYAAVWSRAQQMVREAEIVVILGTDHWDGEGEITLTRQNYEIPFGVLPTSQPVVDHLARELGEERVFAGELRHRTEHSIELAANWLSYYRLDEPCEIVPVLIGSFNKYISADISPSMDSTISTLISVLRSDLEGRRWLVVAAGDLSHVGPAFSGPALDEEGYHTLETSDQAVLNALGRGDQESFYESIRTINDETNICGLAPIYVSLGLLKASRGECLAYLHCPADDENASVVSICGALLE